MRLARIAVTMLPALAAFAPATHVHAASVAIDRTQRSQTIDGFGFFGAHDVWWGSATDMVNTAWFDAVINDLGITIWRNEIQPPADSISAPDADWTKIKPVVRAAAAARAEAAPAPSPARAAQEAARVETSRAAAVGATSPRPRPTVQPCSSPGFHSDFSSDGVDGSPSDARQKYGQYRGR